MLGFIKRLPSSFLKRLYLLCFKYVANTFNLSVTGVLTLVSFVLELFFIFMKSPQCFPLGILGLVSCSGRFKMLKTFFKCSFSLFFTFCSFFYI